ncbi:MAG: helix-turn-helix transcriptional regulator [Pirellulales bacterium]|jgi:DeoR family transcriptional regulator, suf operon transcriptional repressor
MADITVTSAGLRIIRLLVGNPPQTIAQLAQKTGVTRTAISEQLDELLMAGFIERTVGRTSKRGRPCHLYGATDTALLLLIADSQRLIVPALWEAITSLGGEDFALDVLRRVSHVLAGQYKQRITAKGPHERLVQLTRLLDQQGLTDFQDENGQWVMRQRSCPFFGLLDDSRAVCRVHEDMINEIVGAPLERLSCRLNGDPCCSFEIAPPEHGGSKD